MHEAQATPKLLVAIASDFGPAESHDANAATSDWPLLRCVPVLKIAFAPLQRRF